METGKTVALVAAIVWLGIYPAPVLKRTEASADAISWEVGYEDAAFFRRLFKRVTGMTPGAYRRRFQVPSFARSREKSG